jgi:hypothetical protein
MFLGDVIRNACGGGCVRVLGMYGRKCRSALGNVAARSEFLDTATEEDASDKISIGTTARTGMMRE